MAPLLSPATPAAPLAGARIGVTSHRRGEELAASLVRRGASVLHGPTLAGDRPVPDDELLADTSMVLDARPDWLVATTGVGMRLWAEAAERGGLAADLRAMAARSRTVARGAKAVGGLAVLGQRPVWTSPRNTDRDVASWLRGRVLEGETVAVQLHGGTPATYGDVLGDLVDLVTVVSYRWDLPEDDAAARALVRACVAGELDLVTFTSAGAVTNLFAIAAGMGEQVEAGLRWALAGEVAVAAVGPVTAEAVEVAGGVVQVVPRRWRTADLLRSLERWWAQEVAGGASRAPLRLCPDELVVEVGDVRVALGEREYAVLASLSRRPGVLVRNTELLVEGWGHAAPLDAAAVKHPIARLRRKLGPAGLTITTVRGNGYRLEAG